MSSPIRYLWPAANTTLVAPLQTLAGAGTLVLNVTVTYANAFDFRGLNRVVTLTSANNLSGVNFTIVGYLNGQLVTQTIAGPNADTVCHYRGG